MAVLRDGVGLCNNAGVGPSTMKLALTRAAAADVERIFEFGIDRFGLEQALGYDYCIATMKLE